MDAGLLHNQAEKILHLLYCYCNQARKIKINHKNLIIIHIIIKYEKRIIRNHILIIFHVINFKIYKVLYYFLIIK